MKSGNMANKKRTAQSQHKEKSSVKSAHSTPAPSAPIEDHVTPASLISTVAPLTTDIETFTSLRDKLVQRMKDEIKAAELKLAELNEQFSSLFPELVSDELPPPKPKKPKPKASSKSEIPSSEEAGNKTE